MPFKSKAQQRFMFSQEPEVAARWSRETPKGDYKNLPEKVKPKKGKKASSMQAALCKMGS